MENTREDITLKILCFSDLHIVGHNSLQLVYIKRIIKEYKPDVIVISGDIFDNQQINPYKQLSELSDKPIICCLGNHEFSYRTIGQTIQFYGSHYNPLKYNVHYLDIIGNKLIDGVNFFGNVLWYDGTMKDIYSQDDVILDTWLDSKIIDFDWKKQNFECIKKLNNIEHHPSDTKKQFLVTHTVPHIDLNLYSLQCSSYYNMYGGCKNLFQKLNYKVDYSVCGHTHRYVAKQINGTFCVNIGNDYFRRSDAIQFYCFQI